MLRSVVNSARVLPVMTALALLAGAAGGQELKVGVVNLPRLLEEAPQAQEAMQKLQDEFAPRQREIVAHEKDVRDQAETLQRDVAIMAEDERRNAERNLRERQRELARRQNEYLEDLNLRRNEELASLQRSLLKEVREFASAANYDLILGEGVLYASGAVDITPQVLTRLEADFRITQQQNGGN